jgi:hypothetical protein
LFHADADGLPVAPQGIKINPARRLYERHGFRATGETDTHYLMVRPRQVAAQRPRRIQSGSVSTPPSRKE